MSSSALFDASKSWVGGDLESLYFLLRYLGVNVTKGSRAMVYR
jgi:hypothetical protein